ncbi:mCG1041909 [Mus musculus]|jgi:hypothetical protein|nr:mCG1041909 [Mus musculus]
MACAKNNLLKKPDIADSWEAMPEPGKYRGRCLQPITGLSSGSPMGDLEKEQKELKEFANP